MTPDGRYVVFQTEAENFFADNDPDPPGATRVGGIFRYDRLTGDLQLVADGDIVSNADGSTLVRGAANPRSPTTGGTSRSRPVSGSSPATRTTTSTSSA